MDTFTSSSGSSSESESPGRSGGFPTASRPWTFCATISSTIPTVPRFSCSNRDPRPHPLQQCAAPSGPPDCRHHLLLQSRRRRPMPASRLQRLSDQTVLRRSTPIGLPFRHPRHSHRPDRLIPTARGFRPDTREIPCPSIPSTRPNSMARSPHRPIIPSIFTFSLPISVSKSRSKNSGQTLRLLLRSMPRSPEKKRGPAIVKCPVEQMRGRTSLDSQSGRDSDFDCTIQL